MGETETAFHYASRHLDIAKETGDRTGQATAQQNLTELGKVGYHDQCHLDIDHMIVHRSYSDCDRLLFQSLGYTEGAGLSNGKVTPGSPDRSNSRRLSMENMQVRRRTKFLFIN